MNSCGECTFCCEVLPFTHEASWADTYNERYKYDIIYPPGRACNKVCSTGCSIHENKPKISLPNTIIPHQNPKNPRPAVKYRKKSNKPSPKNFHPPPE